MQSGTPSAILRDFQTDAIDLTPRHVSCLPSPTCLYAVLPSGRSGWLSFMRRSEARLNAIVEGKVRRAEGASRQIRGSNGIAPQWSFRSALQLRLTAARRPVT